MHSLAHTGWQQVMELTINTAIEAPAAALATAAGLPMTAGEQTLSRSGLARMVSAMNSNLEGSDHVYETSHGIWPQLDEAGE